MPDYNAVADRNLAGFYRATLGILDGLGDVARGTDLDGYIQQGYEAWQIVKRLGDLNHDQNLETMRKRLAMVILQTMNAEAARLDAAQQFREYATINPETVAFLESYAADMVRGLEADVRSAVEQVLIQGARNGTDVRVQARQIEHVIGLSRGQALAIINASQTAYADALADGATMARAQLLADKVGARTSTRLLKYRAETIARTETIRAQNAGQQAVWRDYQNRGLLPKIARKVWIVTPDDRLDKIICAPMDGREAFVEDDFETPAGPFPYPPAHPRCLPGYSRVTAKGIAATSERWYDGPLVIIQTASGNKLACTPNHPILTPQGWVAAGLLDEGSHVISSGLAEWEAARRGHDSEHVPSSIQQVVESFGRSGHVTPAPVPVAPEDFHGDGLGSEVAVVRTDGLLLDGRDPAFGKHVSEPPLIVGDVELPLLNGGGVLELGGHGDGSPARRFMSGGGLSSAGLGRHLRPLQGLGGGLPANFDARIQESPADGIAVDAEATRDSVLRTAGPVFSDDVISIQIEEFHGMVYNLQTAEGYYLAEGIITHNCRCAMGIAST